MEMKKNHKLKLMCLLAGVLILSSCGRGAGETKVVFTTGFGKDEVFRIANETCKKNELMVYLTNIQNQYEQVYGEAIWNVTLDGMTMEDNVKDTVLARIAQIKTIYLMAKEKGIELDAAEEKKVSDAAREYFASLNQTEINQMDITEDTIEKMYRQYALADKAYQLIVGDVNPEISDDEARIITVQQILIRTYVFDGNGNKITYDETKKAEAYNRINEIRNLALDGEHEFLDLAANYSEDPNITYSFGKNETEEAYEKIAFNLQTNEISEVVETSEGYYIIKCVNTFDREETDANKLKIVEQRKNDVFGKEYEAYVSNLIRDLNEKLWDEINLIHDPGVTTTRFFEIYDQYFKEQ